MTKRKKLSKLSYPLKNVSMVSQFQWLSKAIVWLVLRSAKLWIARLKELNAICSVRAKTRQQNQVHCSHKEDQQLLQTLVHLLELMLHQFLFCFEFMRGEMGGGGAQENKNGIMIHRTTERENFIRDNWFPYIGQSSRTKRILGFQTYQIVGNVAFPLSILQTVTTFHGNLY